jgi:hypothetical protein
MVNISADEFKSVIEEKYNSTSIYHTELNSRTKNILGREYKVNYPSRFNINFVFGQIIIFGKTKRPYTEENLKLLIKLLPKKIKELKKTPLAKELIYKDQLKQLVQETAINHDEHRVYLSGDKTDIYILDSIKDKKNLNKYHACGPILLLAKITRKRTYSKSSKWFPSNREDIYLVGYNESGSKFAHQVSNKCRNIDDAIRWIWDLEPLDFLSNIIRQGDIAVIKIKGDYKEFKDVTDYQIIDSHFCNGKIAKRGNKLYISNGKIYHKKNQHLEIEISGDSWYKIKIGRRSTKGMSGTKD